MSDTLDRFRLVARRFTTLADEVTADAWNGPAPCAGWTAQDIIGHLTGWVPGFVAAAGIDIGPIPDVADDPARAWRMLAAAIESILASPDADRVATFGPMGTLPVETAIGMAVVGDVFIHTWDLAAATGADHGLGTALAAEMLAGMEPIDDLLRSSGHYGPRVAVADDADVVSRLIAFTGRDPGWVAPARPTPP